MSGSDEYEVVSAPEEGHHQPRMRTGFQVSCYSSNSDSDEVDNQQQAEEEEEAALAEEMIEQSKLHTGFELPGLAYSPELPEDVEELVKEIYVDPPQEEQAAVWKPLCLAGRISGGKAKSALMVLVLSVALGLLSLLHFLGNSSQSALIKPAPIYPQAPFTAPVKDEPMERTSLVLLAKRGADLVWESREVFQVRCVLEECFQWLHQCWNNFIFHPDDDSDDAVLMVEPI